MEFLTDPSPMDLTGVIRLTTEAYEAERSTLAQFLPNTHINSNVAKLSDIVATQGDAAEVRSYDAEAPIGKAAEKVRAITFELPPVSQKLRVTEANQLTDIATSNLGATVNRYGKQVGEAIADRLELFRGEVLATGKIDIQGENGVYVDVDFGRDSAMEPTVGTSWEDASATPLADLEEWLEAYSDHNDGDASTLVLSKRALRTLVRNKEIIGAVTDAPAKTRVTPAMVVSLLTEYGITEVVTYDRKVRVAGAQKRVLAEDTVLLLPSAADLTVGRTVFGTTVEAAEAAYGYGIAPEDAPGIVVGAWRQNDPAGVWVHGTAIAAPVLTNPDLAMAAKISK